MVEWWGGDDGAGRGQGGRDERYEEGMGYLSLPFSRCVCTGREG